MPVKGSIQSFFQKIKSSPDKNTNRITHNDIESNNSNSISVVTPNAKSKTKSKLKLLPSNSHCDSISDTAPQLQSQSSSLICQPSTPTSKPITWSCKACTFVNEQTTNSESSEYATCEMCQTPYDNSYHDEQTT